MSMPGRTREKISAARPPPSGPGLGGSRDGLVAMAGMPGPPEEEVEDDEEEEWEYQDETDVYLRSKFFESWLWKDIDLPAQADRDG